MALPDVHVVPQDGRLNLPSSFPAGTFGMVGTSSLGTANSPIVITDADRVAGQFGTGPLANALRDALRAGARTIIAVRVAEGDGGEVGAPVWGGQSGSTGTATASGTSTAVHVVEIEILSTGGLNVATFRWRLDGGEWSDLTTLQATFLVPGTNVTMHFVEGDPAESSFVEGATLSVTTTAGVGTTVEAAVAAAEAVVNKKLPFEFIHVVGASDSAAWVAFQALAEEWRVQNRLFTWFLCEARDCNLEAETVDEYVQALIAEKAAASVNRVAVVACPLIIGEAERNGGAILAGRLAGLQRISTSAGKVALGPLPVSGLGLLDDEDNTLLNDGHIDLLDAAGFCTFRQYAGLAGIYVTNARMLVDATSDYRWIEWRRAMDKACREVRLAGLRRMHDDGDAAGLAALQATLQAPLNRMAAAREVTAAKATIPEGQDVAATSTVNVKVGILPTPTMRWIEIEIGFENSEAA